MKLPRKFDGSSASQEIPRGCCQREFPSLGREDLPRRPPSFPRYIYLRWEDVCNEYERRWVLKTAALETLELAPQLTTTHVVNSAFHLPECIMRSIFFSFNFSFDFSFFMGSSMTVSVKFVRRFSSVKNYELITLPIVLLENFFSRNYQTFCIDFLHGCLSTFEEYPPFFSSEDN